ncbi:MAG: type IV toxin-antitoxin system AbiEi family antitoxin [Aureispira sp.]
MDEDILYYALEQLTATTQLNLQVHPMLHSAHQENYDGQLKLTINSLEEFFFFDVKKRLSLSNLPYLDKYMNRKNNALLIGDYISKPLRKSLKEKQISYLDTSGNTFITNHNGLLIYAETNTSTPALAPKTGNAFSKTGLKVIFQLLIDENILHQPYRNIAAYAHVSLDSVSRILKELKREGYVIQINNKQLKLQHKERLIQEWVPLFNRILRPKLKQQSFRSKDFNRLKKHAHKANIWIGGELAGELLSNYLIAERATFYTNLSFIKAAKQLQLIPSTKSVDSVTLIEKFWQSECTTPTVPSILVYADLLNNPTPRNLETAQIIYNSYVKNTL